MTFTDAPIACSLTAQQYRKRAAETGELARAALVRREPVDGGARLVFRADDGVEVRLRGFVAAESLCCPFLELDLQPGEEHVLSITGPELAQPIIAELFA